LDLVNGRASTPLRQDWLCGLTTGVVNAFMGA
jgi:hypothetical protein